jgi:hypothetical protein
MQELVGRLKALDAEATETLKVIAYFDALVDGHASSEMLVRGAAMLSGCAAGFVHGGTSIRVDASSARSHGEPGEWSSHPFGRGGIAWIERSGPPHANDEMILERVAIALDIALDRSSPATATRRALADLIDGEATAERRLDAIERLHLLPTGSYRVAATPAGSRTVEGTVVDTPVGPVQAVLRPADDVASTGRRMGVGLATAPTALDRSWASALIALRLTSERTPWLLADDLGTLLLLADLDPGEHQHAPDLASLDELAAAHPRALGMLESIAASDSLRAVAVEVGLHHSTVQSRAAEYSRQLGFDVRTPAGRTRLTLALALHRLETTRFD